jgi:hypothetical protein
VGPWAKRGHISSRQASIASVTKTIYRLLGLPSLHLYDAAASDLGDLFATTPDYEPYRAAPVDARVFDPRLLVDPLDPDYRKARAEGERPELDDIAEAMRQVRAASRP